MKVDNQISLLNGNTLELHYWFNDESHSMDAIVQNKCEHEFLEIIKEIASKFESEIIIETEPLAEGGLRRWFKIVSKTENKKGTITTAIIVALATVLITTPIGKITDKLIDKIFEDKELKELEKDKLKLEIKKLKQETQSFTESVDTNNTIKKRKSNFYETLDKYPKVEKVSLLIETEDKQRLSEEKFVLRTNFNEYVLVTDDVEPVEIDNATIEIISPVLKKGKYKWMGIYNGEPIPFNMKSKEFKNLVQLRKVEFKNGTSINCFLIIRKKIDNEGKEKIVGYDVERVNNYFENDKPIETYEGKFHRQKREGDKQQTKLALDNSKEESGNSKVI
jgi:hypothetical protein